MADTVLVDDGASVRETLAEGLCDAGLQVAVACGLHEALEMIGAGTPRIDALVTNCRCPSRTALP